MLYNIENKQEALKINVAYRIDITNTTNTNIEYVYMEKNLQITNLVDTYDHDRYTLFDDNWIVLDVVFCGSASKKSWSNFNHPLIIL